MSLCAFCGGAPYLQGGFGKSILECHQFISFQTYSSLSGFYCIHFQYCFHYMTGTIGFLFHLSILFILQLVSNLICCSFKIVPDFHSVPPFFPFSRPNVSHCFRVCFFSLAAVLASQPSRKRKTCWRATREFEFAMNEISRPICGHFAFIVFILVSHIL